MSSASPVQCSHLLPHCPPFSPACCPPRVLSLSCNEMPQQNRSLCLQCSVLLLSAPRNLELKLKDPDLMSSSQSLQVNCSPAQSSPRHSVHNTASVFCAEVISMPSRLAPSREGPVLFVYSHNHNNAEA